jgi:hypothetical protein
LGHCSTAPDLTPGSWLVLGCAARALVNWGAGLLCLGSWYNPGGHHRASLPTSEVAYERVPPADALRRWLMVPGLPHLAKEV